MAPPQWAYQVEHFVNEPDEELVCSICRAVFCDPVMCPCDHVFCKGCISKWLQNNRNCPICRKRASNSSVKQTVPIVKNLIMKLMLNCRNKSFGCKSQFSLESSEGHMKECEYEFVQCKNKPCADKLFRKDINEHETNHCPHRCIKCKTCGSKIPTSAETEKHDCIRALLLRLRDRRNIIRKKNERIKELRNENKTLKAAAQSSQRLMASSSTRNLGSLSTTLSSLSPDDITINIRELDSFSSSVSSDSDDSSENSIIIFTNSPLEHSDDDDAEFESLSAFLNNQDNMEFSQNENAGDGNNEYRNAGSQALEADIDSYYQSEVIDVADGQQNNLSSPQGNNECDSITTESPESARNSESLQPRRPVKRRPTSDKPAKRKYTANRIISSDDEDSDNESKQTSSQSALHPWPKQLIEVDSRLRDTSMEAGPSSAPEGVVSTNVSSNNPFAISKLNFRSRGKLGQRRSRRSTSAATSGKNTTCKTPLDSTRGNAVFENTLSLLEQYNIESDPEWLPEYASHTGNTPSPSVSDSSNESVVTSSSEHSNSENEDNGNPEDCGEDDYLPDLSCLMQWNFDSTSEDEDDPDWAPPTYDSYPLEL